MRVSRVCSGKSAELRMMSQAALAHPGNLDSLLVGADESVVTFTSFAAGAGSSDCDLSSLTYQGKRTSPTGAYQMRVAKGSGYRSLEEEAFAYDLSAGTIRYYDTLTLNSGRRVSLLGEYDDDAGKNTGLWSTTDGQCQGSFTIESTMKK